MFTDVEIINLGLGSFGQYQIKRIDPPSSALEVFCAIKYIAWKRSELTKHKWLFATEYTTLTPTEIVADNPYERPYKYTIPTWALRPVREKDLEWIQRGRFLWSSNNPLGIEVIRDVPEEEFDPLFVDVLAARIAIETVEYATQNSAKSSQMESRYEAALDAAKQVNAFVRGSQKIKNDDADYDYLNYRQGY